ncbi:cytochrome c peroxidase [Bacillaceae bacterium IKA-2]|nr:cytochrome c peroxidase [Bacillaceae bacterium IKA-2]
MKKSLLSSLLVFILSLGLVACSSNTATEPNEPEKPTETPEVDTVGEVNELDVVIDKLLSNNALVPLGDIPIPEGSSMASEKLELGQILYFDHRLSGNDERSCMTCHVPEVGYGDGRATFETFDGGDGPRNSPTIINSGYYTTNFWDGRAASLEEQALGPIEDPGEMNMPLEVLIPKLKAIDGYEALFLAAGFEDGITAENIGKALASFQRQIVIKDTPYDKFLQGDRDALSDAEVRGLDLFAGKAACINCHQGENLSDNQFHNIGIERTDNPKKEGRMAVTGSASDDGSYRTTGLYGLTHTAPYMIDGSIRTLEEVIDYYDRGGDNHANKSALIGELDLSDTEKADLLAFLQVLGGEPPMFSKPSLPGIE